MFIESAENNRKVVLRSSHEFCSGYVNLRRGPHPPMDTRQRQEPSEPSLQHEGLTSRWVWVDEHRCCTERQGLEDVTGE